MYLCNFLPVFRIRYFFLTDPDPTQNQKQIRILAESGQKFKVSRFLELFFGKKNFVDFLCLSKTP